MNSKLYRLRELIKPASGRSLVVDASSGLALGALPGLERFAEAIQPVLPLADGIVTSPGQSRVVASRTREEAALLVRSDWTNALRGLDFVLPPENIYDVPLLSAEDALDLGVCGMVMYFLLGYEEHIEAQCMQRVVQLALEGSAVGMPILVEVLPGGPRVVLKGKAIELGVSYAMEGGADGIIIPWPGEKSFENILTMAAEAPVWIKPALLQAEAPEIQRGLELGATGLWLDADLFAAQDPYGVLQAFRARVHGPSSLKD